MPMTLNVRRLGFFAFLTGCLWQCQLPGAFAQSVWQVTRQPDPVAGGPQMYDLSCAGRYCYACGVSNAENYVVFVSRSSDGGLNWDEEYPPIPTNGTLSTKIITLDVIDSVHAVGIGYLYDSSGSFDTCLYVRTTNGGQTWSAQYVPVAFQIHFSDAENGILVGGKSILTTTDGGDHWQTAEFRVWNGTLTCHAFGNGNFIVRSSYKLYRTQDNWHSVDSSTSLPDSINQMLISYGKWYFADSAHAILCGHYYPRLWEHASYPSILLMTSDGGRSWDTPLQIDTTITISSGCYPQPNKILLGASLVDNAQPLILQSTDLGHSWSFDTAHFDQTLPENNQMIVQGIQQLHDGSIVALFTGMFGVAGFLARRPAPNLEKQVQPFEAIEATLQVYPNPAHATTSVVGSSRVTICDPLGRAYECPRHGNGLDISRLPAGVYYVSDGTRRARFVKE